MIIDFLKSKYATELSIDCITIDESPSFFQGNEPCQVSFYELIFVTEGQGRVKLEREEITFEAGTILLFPQNKWRQWLSAPNSFNAYVLLFEEEFINNFFNDSLYLYRFHFFYNTSTPSFIKVDEETFQRFIFKLQEVKTEINHLQADTEHLLRSLLYYMLIQINRSYEAHYGLTGSFYQDTIVLNFRKLLEQHIKKYQQVSDYAELLKVSKSKLNQTLKSYFGKNCSELIRDRLLVEIKRALLFSSKSISEIAYELNFSEPANFSRYFQRATQYSPLAYRQKYAN
ncbi:MAG: helix-turn-helix domain-containing protein [Flammeovirgaceae bacterium]